MVIKFIQLFINFGSETIVVLGIIGAVIIIPILARLLFERTWWIFPGGLLYRRESIGRKADVRIFTPDRTALILDVRDGAGAVVDQNRLFRFTADEQARWGVLAAWTSTARRPMEVELLSFLGMATTPSELRDVGNGYPG